MTTHAEERVPAVTTDGPVATPAPLPAGSVELADFVGESSCSWHRAVSGTASPITAPPCSGRSTGCAPR